MNEGRARIITHSAASEGQRRIAKSESVDARNTDVDGVSLHVLAVLRYPRRAGAQEFITPRSTVSTDNVDLRVGMTNGGGQIGEKVENVRIVVLYVAGAMIAQEMIELSFRLRQILVAATVDNVNMLTGVRVIQPKVVLLRGSGFGGAIGAATDDCAQNEQDERTKDCRRWPQETST